MVDPKAPVGAGAEEQDIAAGRAVDLRLQIVAIRDVERGRAVHGGWHQKEWEDGKADLPPCIRRKPIVLFSDFESGLIRRSFSMAGKIAPQRRSRGITPPPGSEPLLVR